MNARIRKDKIIEMKKCPFTINERGYGKPCIRNDCMAYEPGLIEEIIVCPNCKDVHGDIEAVPFRDEYDAILPVEYDMMIKAKNKYLAILDDCAKLWYNCNSCGNVFPDYHGFHKEVHFAGTCKRLNK